MVEALNKQLDSLIASNGEFMKETPIGQIFTQMEYKVDGDNIMLTIPSDASAQLRSIMEANGRGVTGNEKDGYVIDGYPDGSKVSIPASGSADYPSRLAWGGAEGDIKSQADAAKSGMDVWSNIVSKTPPEDTEEVQADVNESLEITDPTSDGAKRIDSALTSLKGKLGSAVGETVYGKFINSLDVGNNGDTIALTSDADAKTFSHMYQQMEMSGVVQGGVEKTADGKYVMNIAEGDADNIVYNLKRWAAFMGSGQEGGDFEGGTEGDAEEDEKGNETPDEKFNSSVEEYNTLVTELGERAHFASRDGAHPMDSPNVVRQLAELSDFVKGIDIPEGRKFKIRLRRLVPPWNDGKEYYIEEDSNTQEMVITPPKEGTEEPAKSEGAERFDEIGKELDTQFNEITNILDSAGFENGGAELEAALAKINELHKEAELDYRPEIALREFHDQGTDVVYSLVENADSQYELKPVEAEETADETPGADLVKLSDDLGKRIPGLKGLLSINKENKTIDINVTGMSDKIKRLIVDQFGGKLSDDGEAISLGPKDAAKLLATGAALVGALRASKAAEEVGTTPVEIAEQLTKKYPLAAKYIKVEGNDVVIDTSSLSGPLKALADKLVAPIATELGLTKGGDGKFRITPKNAKDVKAALENLA